jgi:hypothetical protein
MPQFQVNKANHPDYLMFNTEDNAECDRETYNPINEFDE